MFARLFRTDRAAEAAAAAAYGAIVAQARAPAFYAALGVPDSVTGRFEMVVLHTVLVIERLRREGEAGSALGQRIFDDFCRDMDQSLRELGFGDLGVPKRMKKMGESFYGRAEAYGRTLGDRAGLAEAHRAQCVSGQHARWRPPAGWPTMRWPPRRPGRNARSPGSARAPWRFPIRPRLRRPEA